MSTVELPPRDEDEVGSVIEQSRRQYLYAISYLATGGVILSIIILSLIHSPNAETGMDAFALVVGITLFLALKLKKGNLRILYWIVTFATMIGVLAMTFSPNIGITKNPVSYISFFPMFAIFFLGKKSGIVLTFLYALLFVIILVTDVLQLHLGSEVVFSIFFAIIVVTYTVYLYQDTTDRAQKLLTFKTQELKHVVERLQEEITEKERIARELHESIAQLGTQKEELQRINTLMVGRELAMAEMKKKLQELEHIAQLT